MQEYYDRRAPEYDDKYRRDDPVRQAEQSAIEEALKRLFAGKRVLEVACGTGYWTVRVAQVAANVVATDASEQMLEIARQKDYPANKVEFVVADAYDLTPVTGDFNSGFANFWLSHVRTSDRERFLRGFHTRLGAGATVFMADDQYISGVGGELVQVEGDDDTYKKRWLRDGAEYIIVKNYFTHESLLALLAPYAEQLQAHFGACDWWASYRVKSATR